MWTLSGAFILFVFWLVHIHTRSTFALTFLLLYRTFQRPSVAPTNTPTTRPTTQPTTQPTMAPTQAPTIPSLITPLEPLTNLGTGNWTASSVSSSGTQMVVAPSLGELQVSTNQGLTFTPATGTGGAQSWAGVTQSGNGTLVCAVTTDGKVFVSTNGGVSFTDTTAGVPAGVTGWTAVTAAADDFSVLVATATDGKIYRSTDGVRASARPAA